MTLRIERKWNLTARQVGYVMIGGGYGFNNLWMGTTKEEVIAGIIEINGRREKLGMDALNWLWA